MILVRAIFSGIPFKAIQYYIIIIYTRLFSEAKIFHILRSLISQRAKINHIFSLPGFPIDFVRKLRSGQYSRNPVRTGLEATQFHASSARSIANCYVTVHSQRSAHNFFLMHFAQRVEIGDEFHYLIECPNIKTSRKIPDSILIISLSWGYR